MPFFLGKMAADLLLGPAKTCGTTPKQATVLWRAKRQSSQKIQSRTLSTVTLNEHTTKILKIVWIGPWQIQSWLFVNPTWVFFDKFVRTFFTESNEIWRRWAAPTTFFSQSAFWHLCVFISSQQALNWPLRKETETLWHNGKHDEMHMHAHNQDRTAHRQARKQLCTQPLHAQPQRNQCNQNGENPIFAKFCHFRSYLALNSKDNLGNVNFIWPREVRVYRGTGVSREVRRTNWERSLKNWGLQIYACFNLDGGNSALVIGF